MVGCSHISCQFLGAGANYGIAGGQALNSKMERLMEVVPTSIHDRSGIFMGSYDEMEKVKTFYK